MARQNYRNSSVACGPCVLAVPATISAGEALWITIGSGAIYTAVVAGVRELINVLNVNGADNAGDTKPPLSDYKDALDKVHDEVGKLPKGEDGKFGSPQVGDSKKGYRLDPPHDGAAQGDAESKHHFNWWDYTGGKRGKGGRSGDIPIGD